MLPNVWGMLAAVGNITVPHLSGVFVALDAVTANRSSWRADLQAMKDVGIEFLVLHVISQPRIAHFLFPLVSYRLYGLVEGRFTLARRHDAALRARTC